MCYKRVAKKYFLSFRKNVPESAFDYMGAAVSSLIINLSRQGLIYIPALFVLKALLGVNGLVWAQPVADMLSIGLAVGLYTVTFKKTSRAALQIRRQK